MKRSIPGFYYDAEADAYFAIPKDGCVVSSSAYTRARASGTVDSPRQEGVNREKRERPSSSISLFRSVKKREVGSFTQHKLQSSSLSLLQTKKVEVTWNGAESACQGYVGVGLGTIGEDVLMAGRSGLVMLKADSEGESEPKFRVCEKSPYCVCKHLAIKGDDGMAAGSDRSSQIFATTIVSCESPGGIHIMNFDYETNEFRYRRQWFSARETFWTCCWSPTKEEELAAGSSKGVKIFDVPSGKQRFYQYRSEVMAQSYLPKNGGNVIANGCRDGCLSFLDLRSKASPMELRMSRGICSISPLCQQPGESVMAASMNGEIFRWDLRFTARPTMAYEGHQNSHSVVRPVLDHEERVLYACGVDGVLRGWDVESGRRIAETRFKKFNPKRDITACLSRVPRSMVDKQVDKLPVMLSVSKSPLMFLTLASEEE